MATKAISESPNETKYEQEDYDPHLHRVLSHPNTSLETLFHILKDSLGTGILAMPEAFKYAGVLNGLVSTVIIGIFNTYCIHILVNSQYTICKKIKRPFLSYSESMEIGISMGPLCLRGLTKYAANITDTVVILFQIGVCSVYILFVEENLRDVTNYYLSINTASLHYKIMCFIPFFLIACIKNLKVFAPFSLLGNIINLFTYSVIAYFVSNNLYPFKDLKMLGSYYEYPFFFGTAMFGLQGITVTVLAEINMARPMDFGRPFGVLNVAMLTMTVLYMFVGIMGYWRYADNIKSSITLNFPISNLVGQLVRILYSFAIFISYGLNVLVPVTFFWEAYMEKRYGNCTNIKKLVLDYFIRLICVTITFVLAMTVPFLGLCISLVGNVFLTCLMFIFPALLEVCAHWPDELGTRRWRLWKNILIIFISIIAFAAGTYSTMYEIVKRYFQ